MKTHRVLNRLSKCANVRYRKNHYTFLEISTKNNSLRNLTRFHDGFFELEIPESFARAFLLKTIIWT